MTISNLGIEEEVVEEPYSEVMNMEDFLNENNIKMDMIRESPEPMETIEIPVYSPSTFLDSPESTPSPADIKPATRPSIIIAPKRKWKYDKENPKFTNIMQLSLQILMNLYLKSFSVSHKDELNLVFCASALASHRFLTPFTQRFISNSYFLCLGEPNCESKSEALPKGENTFLYAESKRAKLEREKVAEIKKLSKCNYRSRRKEKGSWKPS